MNGFELKEINIDNRKKTLGLYVTEAAFSNISSLFEHRSANIYVGKDKCTKMGIKGYAWSLNAYAYKVHVGDRLVTKYAIYGTCGDSSFGPAPTFYVKKYGGNIRVARIFYNAFLKYIEENKYTLIGRKFGL
jgi:hypothetical protein